LNRHNYKSTYLVHTRLTPHRLGRC